MAFVAEDGTGKADSNSYGSVTDADTYFTDRAIAAWTGSNSVKQSALIRATDYIEGRFNGRFIGTKKTSTQALSWPRTDAGDYASTIVPVELKKACYEYAVRALSVTLAPDPEVTASGMAVIDIRKKVGPIETDHRSPLKGTGANPMLFRAYPAADMLLRPLIYPSNEVIR